MRPRKDGYWTLDTIEKEILTLVPLWGRMPTASELRAIDRNDLAVKISRTLGPIGWAEKLGLEIKGDKTQFGHALEVQTKEFLEKQGYRIERQSSRAPFDLLVNSVVRVDVKAAKLNTYILPDRIQSAYSFSTSKNRCDLFILCVCRDDWSIITRYYVPSEAAPKSIQIVPINARKYEGYQNISYLKALCAPRK